MMNKLEHYVSGAAVQALALDDPTYHDGTDYTLVPEHSFCWITVDSLVVKIKRSTTEGVGVEIYLAPSDCLLANLEEVKRIEEE